MIGVLCYYMLDICFVGFNIIRIFMVSYGKGYKYILKLINLNVMSNLF